jgi:predicted nucleic acid-binding protein
VAYVRPTAVLDACVLYPIAVTDALISLGSRGLFRAKWTTRIESEWTRAIENRRPDLVGRLGTRRDAMRAAIVDWEVADLAVEAISLDAQLPDPDDGHVIAAAIGAQADLIVSFNVADFPQRVLDTYGLEVVHPDEFIVSLKESDDLLWIDTFASMKQRLRKPVLSSHEFAEAFERAGLPNTADALRAVADSL